MGGDGTCPLYSGSSLTESTGVVRDLIHVQKVFFHGLAGLEKRIWAKEIEKKSYQSCGSFETHETRNRNGFDLEKRLGMVRLERSGGDMIQMTWKRGIWIWIWTQLVFERLGTRNDQGSDVIQWRNVFRFFSCFRICFSAIAGQNQSWNSLIIENSYSTMSHKLPDAAFMNACA